MKKISLKDILNQTTTKDLHQFIRDYATSNPAFEQALQDQFSPRKKTSTPKQDYPSLIHTAFNGNTLNSGNRYRGWDDVGFDAESVRADLEPLLEKINYFLQYENTEEALKICQALVETIPEEWDANFDYEGDVQVVYDGAIDKLQQMLEENILSAPEKQSLFEWYRTERKNAKHEYVGLNTELQALENYFIDSPEMLRENLADIEKQIKNTEDRYDKERAILRKINLLEKAGLQNETQQSITQYLHFSRVRELRLKKYLKDKDYTGAIALILEGVKRAQKDGYPGIVSYWQNELLKIYESQKDYDSLLRLAEKLFAGSSQFEGDKYYQLLKKFTNQKEWLSVLERLLGYMKDGKGFYGFNELKAGILVEHNMWQQLYEQCSKGGIAYMEQYEKYLKPLYAKEIFAAFHKYVEQQAAITHQEAYQNVARVLKKMKKYEGGTMIVRELINKYREVYKRRKNMLLLLNKV